MRVPNERDSPTGRIEVQFPLEANIGYFEQKAPWKLELKRDDKKKILSAVWSGGVLNLNEYAEFKFSARNPAAAGTLTAVDPAASPASIGEGSDRRPLALRLVMGRCIGSGGA